MPYVIVNLGGEMIYILEQRLRAQSIPPEKAVKVLHDVVKTMFSTKFIAEVPSPEPFSKQRLRAFHLAGWLWRLHRRRPARAVPGRCGGGASPCMRVRARSTDSPPSARSQRRHAVGLS
jgi:hypothetical protein